MHGPALQMPFSGHRMEDGGARKHIEKHPYSTSQQSNSHLIVSPSHRMEIHSKCITTKIKTRHTQEITDNSLLKGGTDFIFRFAAHSTKTPEGQRKRC